jgi:hypothetical protein
LRQDGLKVWFGQWKFPVAAARESAAFSSGGQTREEEDGGALPRRRYAEKIEKGLKHFRAVPLAHWTGEGGRRPSEGRAANAFRSDWAQLEAGTCGRRNLPFRDPLNQERRFIPLRLDDAPSKAPWRNSFTSTGDKRIMSSSIETSSKPVASNEVPNNSSANSAGCRLEKRIAFGHREKRQGQGVRARGQ